MLCILFSDSADGFLLSERNLTDDTKMSETDKGEYSDGKKDKEGSKGVFQRGRGDG